MDLLNQILRQPIDPDYARVAQRHVADQHFVSAARPRWFSGRWGLAAVALLIGAMFAVGAAQTTRSAPAQESERTELIERVRTAEQQQDSLRVRIDGLNAQIGTLRGAALGNDSTATSLENRIESLEPVVGTVPVTGPGLVIVVDDAPSASADARDRVLDLDLQVLANGLWSAGAEAVSINGHRLSVLTAIRSAGDAITVDYRSLNPPYRVEAIGDPRTLAARYAESAAGAWWNDLARNRRMGYEVSDAPRLTLPADPGLQLRYAKGNS
jgi:uncharacterized protein YlxW (UPF0749 family)